MTSLQDPSDKTVLPEPVAGLLPRWRLSRVRHLPDRDVPIERHIATGHDEMSVMFRAMLAHAEWDQEVMVAPLKPVSGVADYVRDEPTAATVRRPAGSWGFSVGGRGKR